VGRPKSPAVAVRDEEIYARWISREYATFADLAKVYNLTPQRIGQIVAAREREVYQLWRSGKYTLADLAERYELTAEDISGIVAARHPEQDEGVSRAVLRSRLELLSIAVQEIVESPGYKLAPNGRLAEDEDGNPLVDVGARIEAVKVQVSLIKNLAVLNGDEKPTRSLVTHDIAEQQKNEAMARITAQREAELREIEVLRRRAAVVPGEVVRELPAGGV